MVRLSAVLSLVSSIASSISLSRSAARPLRVPITRIFTPFLCRSARSRRMKRGKRPNRSLISCLGRAQFSEEKLNSVRWVMPSSIEASTIRRTLSTPWRWPSARGSPRSAATRPLPSMMIAIWRTAGRSAAAQASLSTASVTFGCSGLGGKGFALWPCPLDLHNLGFLAGKGLIDFLYDLVGQVLHLCRERGVLVLAHLVVLLGPLEMLHAVATNIAHSNARLLGVFVGNLGNLVTPLLVELGNGKAQELSVDPGGET